MIYQNSTVTVSRGVSKIDYPIILYRGDREIEIALTIKGSSFKYRTAEATNIIGQSNASHAQMIIKKPNGTPVFSEEAETVDGNVIFTITAEMIDEISEVGSYDFQIRLFDSDKTSRVTIPPVVDGFEIREPIASEDISPANEVDIAMANYAMTATAAALDAFDENGNYIETTWVNRQVISSANLNKIEQGITGVNQKADSATRASNITISDTANNFTATNVEDALAEVGSQIKDIENELKTLKLVAGDNNTIKLMLGDLELSSLTISGGTVEEAVYGNLVFDKSFVKIAENGTAQIGIKLDTEPTQDQTITISEDSDAISVDKTSLTFTSDNYDTYQYITVTVSSIDESETANIKFINSDELLTESNVSIYAVAEGSEYSVDTTFPEGAYTLTASDFSDNTTNGDYVILGAYNGTETNVILPSTMDIDGVTKKVIFKRATFNSNTTIQYIQIDSEALVNEYGTVNQLTTCSLNGAFQNCTSLIGFKYICDKVVGVNSTWDGCTNLKFVVGLEGYVNCTTSSQAFKNCTELEYIQDLSALSLCTDLNQAFNECTKLKKVYGLPSGAQNMNMALYNCSSLESIVVPENVTNLFYCFSRNTSLKKIEILSEGVTNASEMLQGCGTVSVYMVKDSTTYTTISGIYSSASNVTLSYLGGSDIPVISTWGDSTTSTGTDGLSWPARLQEELTSHNVKNMAISGEYTTSTSCRQGGNQAHIKTSFTIPSTCTSVEIELESKDGQTFSNSPVLSTGCNYNPVTISDIKGSISLSGNEYYFTRYDEGDEVQVAANTEVISETSVTRKNDDIMIIYLGTNSGWDDTPSKLLAQVQSMVDYYQGTKYIITTGATGYRLRNESTRAMTTEVETLFANTFGEHYFSLRQYLIDNSLTENNLTATDVDTSRIALGQVPASILSGADDLNSGKAGGDGVDDTHYNTYGLESVKNAFKSKLISLGYITVS